MAAAEAGIEADTQSLGCFLPCPRAGSPGVQEGTGIQKSAFSLRKKSHTGILSYKTILKM